MLRARTGILICMRSSNQVSFAHEMRPESGRVSPASQSSNVVLPAPEAPKRMATPGESAKSTSSVNSRPAPLRRFLMCAESVFEKTDGSAVIAAGSDTVVIERNGRLPCPHGLPLLAGLVFHDVACNRARRHGQRAGEIHLSRPAAAWEVTILGADHDLIRPRRNSGSGINASAAAWLNHMRAGVLENIDIALAYTVIARFLRTKLDIELHRVRDAFALTQGVGQYARIHIHIFIFPCRARAPVSNLHRHRRIQLADVLTIPRIARRCHHGCDLGSIQLDHLSVLRVIVAAQALNQRFRLFAIHGATLNQKFG